MKYNLEALQASSNAMSEGAEADIWYDAREYRDTKAEIIINDVQSAIGAIHDAMPDLLDAVRLLRTTVNAGMNDQANQEKVLALLAKFA